MVDALLIAALVISGAGVFTLWLVLDAIEAKHAKAIGLSAAATVVAATACVLTLRNGGSLPAALGAAVLSAVLTPVAFALAQLRWWLQWAPLDYVIKEQEEERRRRNTPPKDFPDP